jgi:hypothetical protein
MNRRKEHGIFVELENFVGTKVLDLCMIWLK